MEHILEKFLPEMSHRHRCPYLVYPAHDVPWLSRLVMLRYRYASHLIGAMVYFTDPEVENGKLLPINYDASSKGE